MLGLMLELMLVLTFMLMFMLMFMLSLRVVLAAGEGQEREPGAARVGQAPEDLRVQCQTQPGAGSAGMEGPQGVTMSHMSLHIRSDRQSACSRHAAGWSACHDRKWSSRLKCSCANASRARAA